MTVVTGALGIGLNYVWEQRERSRQLILVQYDQAHEDATALRNELADLMARQNTLRTCATSNVEACTEQVATERKDLLRRAFVINWSVPHAFGENRAAAAAIADNSWTMVNYLRFEVQSNDMQHVECLLGAREDCEGVYAKSELLDKLQNFCLATLACMAAHREIELREEMIEQGMRNRDRELAERVRGPVITDDFCTDVLRDRQSACAGEYDDFTALKASIMQAAY